MFLFVMENGELEASPRTTRLISCREDLNAVAGLPPQPERGLEVENAVTEEDLGGPTEAAVR